MSASDIVRVSGWEVERKVLDQMGRELSLYESKQMRTQYLSDRIQQMQARLSRTLQESSGPADGMPRGSDPGNPVLAKVERMDEIRRSIDWADAEMQEIETWTATVDLVRRALTERQGAIIDELYLKPRNEREYTMVGIANQLSMSQSEAYRTKDEALLEFVLVLKGKKELVNVGENVGKIREAQPLKVG